MKYHISKLIIKYESHVRQNWSLRTITHTFWYIVCYIDCAMMYVFEFSVIGFCTFISRFNYINCVTWLYLNLDTIGIIIYIICLWYYSYYKYNHFTSINHIILLFSLFICRITLTRIKIIVTSTHLIFLWYNQISRMFVSVLLFGCVQINGILSLCNCKTCTYNAQCHIHNKIYNNNGVNKQCASNLFAQIACVCCIYYVWLLCRHRPPSCVCLRVCVRAIQKCTVL